MTIEEAVCKIVPDGKELISKVGLEWAIITAMCDDEGQQGQDEAVKTINEYAVKKKEAK